jgi:hypothetical protein
MLKLEEKIQVSNTTFLEFKYATMFPIKIILRCGIELSFLGCFLSVLYIFRETIPR